MKIKILTAAVISAMLTFTACGETDKADTTSEKPAETTTTTAASEEVTTEAVTEEVTTETTPAVETTVTTTTEATTTTEEIPPEHEKEEFKLAEGLSEKYVDFDNMAIEYNGHIFRFEEATIQDFLDAGVELDTDDDLEDDYVADHETVDARVNITGSISARLIFKPRNGQTARECVLKYFSVVLVNYPGERITYGTNYGEGMVHSNIPLRLKMSELTENSGDPTERRTGSFSGSTVYEYTAPSLYLPDRDDRCSEYKFIFYNGDLVEFDICSDETKY
ncbi:hypothetical protein [Ruminococcus albus]|uniref:Lipoprotein n=1 Tax=Ruminococcus albus TaxID=1264 RepID=A0A1H7PDQ6_RUMAL|nr:hypothetical protein [Ruminococcus albus]SEL33910.1 hypothetical protein SAMN05216469_1214 [Ruminococcus albus]